jgi:uncharacterized membrane protein
MRLRILTGLAFALSLPAQTITTRANTFNHSAEMRLQAVSTAGTAPCLIGPGSGCSQTVAQATTAAPPAYVPDSTIYVCGGLLIGTGQTITLTDGNGHTVYSGVLGASAAPVTYPISSTCIAFVGGVFLNASASGAVASLVFQWNQ